MFLHRYAKDRSKLVVALFTQYAILHSPKGRPGLANSAIVYIETLIPQKCMKCMYCNQSSKFQ
jgi:hypothetical protein